MRGVYIILFFVLSIPIGFAVGYTAAALREERRERDRRP